MKIETAVCAGLALALMAWPTATAGQAATPAATQTAGPPANTPAGQSPAKSAKPMDAFAWVIGGTWTADVAKTMPGMLRIETQYSVSDNGSFVRFTTHFVSTKGTLKNYDGNFYWDPAEKTYRVWYADSAGNLTAGPVILDGDHWDILFTGTDFEGKQAELRAQVDRKSPDLYHWSLSEKSGDAWKPLLGLDYQRK